MIKECVVADAELAALDREEQAAYIKKKLQAAGFDLEKHYSGFTGKVQGIIYKQDMKGGEDDG